MADRVINTNGTDHSDDLYGGEYGVALYGLGGGDKLYGGAGDDYLDGGNGNDILYGGAGDETYTFTWGDGADTILDTQGDDTLIFGIDYTQLWFQKTGVNGRSLEIGVLGSDDKVTTTDWFAAPSRQIEHIQAGGFELAAADVQEYSAFDFWTNRT
jgi:Ca2+-binding RTX toxin-like protein